jgi:choline kinase
MNAKEKNTKYRGRVSTAEIFINSGKIACVTSGFRTIFSFLHFHQFQRTAMKPALVILAAGMGSRFGGLKQMEPIGPGGEFLIDYTIYDARRAGFGTAVFVITRKIEAEFRRYMEARYGNGAPFSYVFQELDAVPAGCAVPAGRVKPWGTGHAVLACRSAVDVPFAVVNADDFYGRRSFDVLCRALEAMPPDGREFVMVGFRLENTLSEHGAVARGVCTAADGRLVSIVEREKVRREGGRIIFESPGGEAVALDPHAPVSMNCWGFAPQTLFPRLETVFASFFRSRGSDPNAEFFLLSAVNDGIAAGTISVKMLDSSERWFGLTHQKDLAVAKAHIAALVRRGDYPERLD